MRRKRLQDPEYRMYWDRYRYVDLEYVPIYIEQETQTVTSFSKILIYKKTTRQKSNFANSCKLLQTPANESKSSANPANESK